MNAEWANYQPYQPRKITWLGTEQIAGYSMKLYAIQAGDSFQRERFEPALFLAAEMLPELKGRSGCPGLGFAILHQGATGDYLICCWWDRENELPTRVLINDGTGWRVANGGESFCVWDLRIVWWEREAYVATILGGAANAQESYRSACLRGYA